MRIDALTWSLGSSSPALSAASTSDAEGHGGGFDGSVDEPDVDELDELDDVESSDEHPTETNTSRSITAPSARIVRR